MYKFRKSLVLSILMASVLLSGCGLFSSEPEIVSKTGVLVEQRPGDEFEGTHLLVTDEGDFALRSISLNLSNERYLDNRVQILGKPDEDIIDVTGVSVVEVLNEEEEEDGELEKYSNSDQGFKLSYYSDWEVSEDGDATNFVSPDGDKVSISQTPYAYSPTLSEDGESDTAISAYFVDQGNDIEDIDEFLRFIGPDNLEALYFKLPDDSEVYELYRNGLIYAVSFMPGDVTDSDRGNEFKTMIKSFRFTAFTAGDEGFDDVEDRDQEDDAEPEADEDVEATSQQNSEFELTTFESLPFEFRASYPASWYYAGTNSADSGVLHHYGFSDESVEDDNEILALDIVSGSFSKSGKRSFAGKDIYVSNVGGNVRIYAVVDDLTFRLSGPKKFEGLLIDMALSISKIER